MNNQNELYKILDNRLITENFSISIKDIKGISLNQPWFAKVFSVFFGILLIFFSSAFIANFLEHGKPSAVSFFFISAIVLSSSSFYFFKFRRLIIKSKYGKYTISIPLYTTSSNERKV